MVTPRASPHRAQEVAGSSPASSIETVACFASLPATSERAILDARLCRCRNRSGIAHPDFSFDDGDAGLAGCRPEVLPRFGLVPRFVLTLVHLDRDGPSPASQRHLDLRDHCGGPVRDLGCGQAVANLAEALRVG